MVLDPKVQYIEYEIFWIFNPEIKAGVSRKEVKHAELFNLDQRCLYQKIRNRAGLYSAGDKCTDFALDNWFPYQNLFQDRHMDIDHLLCIVRDI